MLSQYGPICACTLQNLSVPIQLTNFEKIRLFNKEKNHFAPIVVVEVTLLLQDCNDVIAEKKIIGK